MPLTVGILCGLAYLAMRPSSRQHLGYIVYIPAFPSWLGWLSYGSYMRFSFLALVLNELNTSAPVSCGFFAVVGVACSFSALAYFDFEKR
eukprot:gene40704-49634_t